MPLGSLRITEIFHSLQGETRTVGIPTVFVRLTGCPLRCTYCDTAYAFSGGKQMELAQILSDVRQYGARFVTVTGGEPLAQPACLPLLTALCDEGYEVSLETSGAMPVVGVDPRVVKVVDLKTPDSGEMEKNDYANMALLLAHDQVKFVVCSVRDYQWVKAKILEFNLSARVSDVLLSPSFGQVDPTTLAEWILRDRLKVRMQVQLHKLLWADAAGH